MLSIFRSILHSKIGALFALLVLVVIALAFASGDIAGLRNITASDGSTVATVGGEKISATLLQQSAKSALDRVKQQTPSATMKMLILQGGLEQVLDDLVNRAALFSFGKDNKVVASDRLVDSEIAKIPGFQGVDGKFDQTTFRNALARQGISEAALRNDLAQTLVAEQIVSAAQFGTVMPRYAAQRYSALLDESRTGSVIALPSLQFAPKAEPTDAQLTAFYKDHINHFVQPERRVLRYALFGQDAVKNVAAPTEAEIAAMYNTTKGIYGAQDNRKISQLIVPTEAAAKAVEAEVAGGKTLEAVASEKGLSAGTLDFFSHQQISGQFSPAVADAVFATTVGKLAPPQKSALGWHVIRVDQEQKKPARTLADVHDEIANAMAAQKKQAALSALLSKLDDQFGKGANLNEVAKSIGVQVQQTAPITADGSVFGQQGQTVAPTLRPLLTTAFAMDQEQPQVAEVEKGKTFAIFDVSQISAAAPAPLAQIRNDVKLGWMMDAGTRAAKAAALQMQAELRKGKTIEQVVAETGKQLPQVQQIAMSRPTLTAALRAGRQIPPPVSLLFHMAKGTIKVQQAGSDRGWFVVVLKDVVPGKVDSPQLIAGAQQELGGQLGDAYATAFAKAVRNQVGVKRDESAIKSVRDQLAGDASTN